MQPIIVKITDPEYGSIELPIEEDISPEALKEIIDALDEDTRETWASDRKYHRYNYSLESRVFEGMDYAYRKTPEWICIHKEEYAERGDIDEQIERYLSVLTETQQKRMRMRLKKLSFRDIARIEGTDESSIRESIKAAHKRLQKKYPKIF